MGRQTPRRGACSVDRVAALGPLTKDAVDTRVAEREAKAITAIEAVQAAVLSVVLISFWLVVSPLVQQPVCCDAGEYLRLARDPTSPMLRPYSMRVLVPWLVHALGGDVVTTFHAVSLVCLAITGWLMYLLARQLGVGHGYALLATAALLCSRGWLFFFYDPYLTEPAAFLLLTAAFLVLVRNRRTWLIAPLLVLMAATREQFIGFALPTYFWLYHRHHAWRALSQTIGLLLPALVVFAALATLPHVLPPTRSRNRWGSPTPSIAAWRAMVGSGSPARSPCHWECGGRWLWSACVLTGFDGCPGG